MLLFFFIIKAVKNMGHRETRNGYENCNIGVFSKEHTAGKYDIPIIQPLHELDCKEFIGFEEMMNRLHPRRILFNGKVPDELKDLFIIEPMLDAYPRYRKERVGNG